MNEKINVIVGLLDQIVNDRTVPRNIRNAADSAKSSLKDSNIKDLEVKISTAVTTLDEIINDPNMPMYTRTQIWNIVSMLESLRSNE